MSESAGCANIAQAAREGGRPVNVLHKHVRRSPRSGGAERGPQLAASRLSSMSIVCRLSSPQCREDSMTRSVSSKMFVAAAAAHFLVIVGGVGCVGPTTGTLPEGD